MQVAKLFASLGFKIDTADLSNFESILNKTQGEMSQFARDTNLANQKLKTMQNRFKATSGALNSTAINKAAGSITKAVNNYVKKVTELVNLDPSVKSVFHKTGVRLDLLANKIDGGTSAWTRYVTQVNAATTSMNNFTAAARARQSANPPRSTGAGSGSNQGGGAGGRGSGGRGNNGVDEQGGMSGMLLGGQKFGKAFVGQMAMGGALGLGYLIKEAVQTGREIDSMIFKIQAVSRGTQEFQSNLKYVRETAQYLAVDVEEFGNAYAQIFQGSKNKYSQTQIQEMFTGFNEYFKTLKMSADDQKGALRGISQMFGKEKVQAQELILQVGQRTAGMIQVFAEANDMTVAQLLKTMELGKTTTDMVVKAGLASAKAAKAMGTLPDALKTSVSAQARFTNELKWLSHTILKIVDPALAKLFDGLALAIAILKPLLTGLFTAIGGVLSLVALLFSFDWQVYAIIAATALAVIVAGFYSIGGAALVAEVAVYGLGVAMGALQRLIPLAALAGMIYFLGEYTKWQKEQESGVETFTWIDLWSIRLQFFFALMKIGWLNTRIAISDSINAIDKFFSITPPKWFSDFMERKKADPKAFNQEFADRWADNSMSPLRSLSGVNNRTATIPVDVNVNVKMPDGSVQTTKTTQTSQLSLGSMGVPP